MDFYQVQLIFITILCLFSVLISHYISKLLTTKSRHLKLELETGKSHSNAFNTLARQYLIVYAIVMGL